MQNTTKTLEVIGIKSDNNNTSIKQHALRNKSLENIFFTLFHFGTPVTSLHIYVRQV